MNRGCGNLISIPILIFGLVFTAVGAGFLLFAPSARTHDETTGVIVALSANHSSDGTTYAPVIEFEAPDGEMIRFTSNFSRSPAPHVGDSIGVFYDPLNPHDAAENSTFFRIVFPSIFLTIGIAILAVGVRVAVKGRLAGPTPAATGPQPQSGHWPSTETTSRPSTSSSARLVETAQFRRVEPRGPDENGAFEYRIVARAEDGERYYSKWLAEDPTTAVIKAGVHEVRIEWRDGVGMIVDFPT